MFFVSDFFTTQVECCSLCDLRNFEIFQHVGVFFLLKFFELARHVYQYDTVNFILEHMTP